MSGILGGPDDDELLSILCDGGTNLVGGTTALGLLDHAPYHITQQQQVMVIIIDACFDWLWMNEWGAFK